jgi:hypothetical protein
MGPKKGFIRNTKARDTPTNIARKVRVSSFAYIFLNVPDCVEVESLPDVWQTLE